MESWVLIWLNVAWVEAYLRTKWHNDPSSRLAITDMGQKLQGAAVPFFWGGGELDVPIYHNVAWAEAYLELPSGILIHPVVWPQYTNVTKQTHRQQSDSIGEPFIQTVV